MKFFPSKRNSLGNQGVHRSSVSGVASKMDVRDFQQRTSHARTKGDIDRDRKQWSSAIKHYREHLGRYPDDLAIKVQLGHALKEAGFIREGKRLYSEALKLAPNDSDLHLQLGHVSKLQGNLFEAFFYYERSFSIDASNISAQLEIAAIDVEGVSLEDREGKLYVAAILPYEHEELIHSISGADLMSTFLIHFDVDFYRKSIADLNSERLSLKAVIDHFLKVGIDNIDAIAHHLYFEPEFYVNTYCSDRAISSSDAYRLWLNQGLSSGHSPNLANWLSTNLRLEIDHIDSLYPEFYKNVFKDFSSSQFTEIATYILTENLPNAIYPVTSKNIHIFLSCLIKFSSEKDHLRSLKTLLQIALRQPYVNLASYQHAVLDDVVRSFPFFSVNLYVSHHEASGSLFDAFVRYAISAEHTDLSPHPLFWADWYREKYMQTDTKTNALVHFLSVGQAENFSPNPLFDSRWYRYVYHIADDVNCLDHYISGGAFHHDPHPLFLTNYYISQKHYQRGIGSNTPLEDFFSYPNSANPCPLFDPQFYAAECAMDRATDDNSIPLLVHYIDNIHNIDCDPHSYFSKKYYLKHSPDVALSGLDPLYHYLSLRNGECRQPHPLFDDGFYRERYSLDASQNALAHYLTIGFSRGYSPRPLQAPDVIARMLPKNRQVVTISRNRSLEIGKVEDKVKVGAFIHAFYVDIFPELIEATNNINVNCMLFISTNSLEKARLIEIICAQSSNHPYEIRVTPNRGRDIAPMFVGFSDAFDRCDYGVHIHTKKSLHYEGGFSEWRKFLVDGNLGSRLLVENVLKILSHEEVGVVAPDHLPAIEPLIQWGGNFDMIKDLLELHGQALTKDHALDFASGSMFWFKTKALKSILDLNLQYEHFDPEEGQVDGTLAHALERSLFYFSEISGYRHVIIRSDGVDRDLHYNSDVVSNRILPLSAELGQEKAYYPECGRFAVSKSSAVKPRLNLLIPFVDSKKGYAGASTAFEIFNKLGSELGKTFDLRMIGTDVPISCDYVCPEGFSIVDEHAIDVDGISTVVDGVRRSREFLPLRRNDIFLSSAWWNAGQALDLISKQRRIFPDANGRLVYLIQDFEPGFYPWSTKYELCFDTYRHPDRVIPVYNTGMLQKFMIEKTGLSTGHVLDPAINPEIRKWISYGRAKEKILLIYARPHAERNCLPFIDMVISSAVQYQPEFWKDWRFYAIGEDFNPLELRCSRRIEVMGRLTLEEYGALSSRAALGLSLMVSPHPSYPPLELAEAGVLTLTNVFEQKDLSSLHANISSFQKFDADEVAHRLFDIARMWQKDVDVGWRLPAKIDWFFSGKTNIGELVGNLAAEIRSDIGF